MENLDALALKIDDGKLLVLDQRQLPFNECWVHCQSPDEMCDIIATLQVRGAPLIGIAAALAIAIYAEEGATAQAIIGAAGKLLASRPTAVNLRAALDRLVFSSDDLSAGRLTREAAALFREDIAFCERISRAGASLVADGDRVLTHCNTGSLVTAGAGTALGALKEAWQQSKRLHVYVDETRPLLQGARLTTWELESAKIPYTLICDNAAAALMAQGKIDKVFVGADRIALNGDVANKIGTYSLAVLANYHRIPFYVLAPCTTVDLQCESGREIPVEQRDGGEVRGFAGFNSSAGEISWAPVEAATCNPAFDVTPVDLITAIVLDCGILTRSELQDGALGHADKLSD